MEFAILAVCVYSGYVIGRMVSRALKLA